MVTCLILSEFVHAIFTLTPMYLYCVWSLCMCTPFLHPFKAIYYVYNRQAMYAGACMTCEYVRIYNGPDQLMTYKYIYMQLPIAHWLHNLKGEYLIWIHNFDMGGGAGTPVAWRTTSTDCPLGTTQVCMRAYVCRAMEEKLKRVYERYCTVLQS